MDSSNVDSIQLPDELIESIVNNVDKLEVKIRDKQKLDVEQVMPLKD